MGEVEGALVKTRKIATEKFEISYMMLKHLSTESKDNC